MATIALPVGGIEVKSKTTPQSLTAGTTLTAGQWIYKASADEKAYPADNSTAEKATVIGVAIMDCVVDNPCYYVSVDDVVVDYGGTLTRNQKYVLSNSGSAGQMEDFSDLGSSEYVTYLCTAVDDNTTDFKIKIEITGQQIP